MDYASKVPKEEHCRPGKDRWWFAHEADETAFKYKPNIYFRFDIHFLTDIKQDNEVEK